MFTSWLRSLADRLSRPTTHSRRAARGPSFRPWLEALEERLVPATHTWTGAGATNLWSDSGDWTGGVPVNNDNLIFPASSPQLATYNNLTGLRIASITFQGNGYSLGGDTLTLNGGIYLSPGVTGAESIVFNVNVLTAATFEIDNASATLSFANVLSAGAGVTYLDKYGPGNLALTNSNNFPYVLIHSGTLTVLGDSALSGAGELELFDGTTIQASGSRTINTIVFLYSPGVNPPNVTVGGSGDLAFTGNIGEDLYSDAQIVKTSTGTLTLSGNNSYSGGTQIVNGTLAVGGDSALGSGPASLRNTTTIVSSGGAHTISNAITLYNTVSGFPTLVTIGGSNSLTLSGVISEGPSTISSLRQTDTSTLTLSGTNSFRGGVEVAAGTLAVGSSSALGTGGLSLANGTALEAVGGGRTLTNNIAISGTATLAGSNFLAFGGVVSGNGSLVQTDTATVLLSQPATYTGATTIQRGTLLESSSFVLPPATALTVSAGAVFNTQGYSARVGSLAGAGTVYLGFAGDLDVGGNNASTSFSGTIGGANSRLIKEGTGTLTLNGNNNLWAATLVNAGTLRVGSTNSLPASLMTVAAGAILDLNGFNATVSSLSGVSGAAVTLGGGTLTTNGNNAFTDFAGSITGSGGLVKLGTGGLLLDGNDTYSGPTVIQAGYISVNGNLVNSPITIASAGSLVGSGTVGTVTVNGELQAAGPSTLHATGNTTFNAGSTFTVTLNPTGFGSGIGEFVSSAPVNLTGAPALHVYYGLPDPFGTSYTVIQSSAGITGTFNGLPDNAVFTSFIGGVSLRIHYTANAVIVTRVSATATTLTSAPNSSVYGQSVTLTAVVTATASGATTPTGTVTFLDGGTVLGTAALDANGRAVLTRADLGAGGHSLTAVYQGQGAFVTSTSAALAQTVSPAPLTITADAQSKVAGDSVPTLTASYSGFVLGDTSSVLTTPVTLTTYSGNTAGTYAIVASGAAAANYTITFVPGTLTVTPAVASTLVVSGFPTQVTAGDGTNQVTVTAYDAYGNVATGYTGTVTFSSSDAQATLPADTTLANGTGTFGVTLFTAGAQSLTVSDSLTGSITGTQSGITVTPSAADHLLLMQQPTDTAAGQTISTVIVEVVDQFGNVVTTDNTDTITLSIGNNPSGGTLSGTLTLTVTAGVATFNDLSIDLAGAGYTLHATIGAGLPDIDSNPFNITM
jgi:fibronectin-binding autotransporter adhesin